MLRDVEHFAPRTNFRTNSDTNNFPYIHQASRVSYPNSYLSGGTASLLKASTVTILNFPKHTFKSTCLVTYIKAEHSECSMLQFHFL